jgi:hypothetical protein
MTNKTIPTIIAVSFILVAIPAALFLRSQPKTELTPSEKELIEFSNKPVALSTTQPQTTFSGLNSPIKTTSKPSKEIEKTVPAPNTTPIKAKSEMPRSLASLPAVSMIYSAGSTRMAVIDGHVVQDGSPLDGGIVVKIEETRVLMRKNGKDIWLTTE